MNTTEQYSKLLHGRLPSSDLEMELCDKLIQYIKKNNSLKKDLQVAHSDINYLYMMGDFSDKDIFQNQEQIFEEIHKR